MGAHDNEDVRLIGQKIAIKRMDAGYSQEEFADLVGISKTAMGKIERGVSVPSADTLISVCRALHTAPNELFPDDLSEEDSVDSGIAQMAVKVRTLSPSQQKQFFNMMNIVLLGIQASES